MSELKVFTMPLKTNIFGRTIVAQSYYDKSEADKYIQELKAALDRSDKSAIGWNKKWLEATHEIESLKESQQWRKVSEELPEDGSKVLATDGDGIWLCYKTTMCDGSPWFQPDGQPHIEGVTHWMPLPKAPKEGK